MSFSSVEEDLYQGYWWTVGSEFPVPGSIQAEQRGLSGICPGWENALDGPLDPLRA